MDSNNGSDGNQDELSLGVPAPIDEAFRATNSREMAFALRKVYRAIGGTPIGDKTREAAQAELVDYGFGDLLPTIEPVYNHVLENVTIARPRRYNHGARLSRQLGNLTCVLPTGLAQRFPLVIDRKHRGEVRHEDKYGQVYCSTTLRPQHLGIVAAACGIYANRGFYEDKGIVTPDGDVMLSERKLYWLGISTGDPGGAGLTEIRRLLTSLAGAQMWATQFAPDERARSRAFGANTSASQKTIRDRTIESNPVASIERLVVAEDGPIWAAVDDPRPTAVGHELTIKIELAPWCRNRLDHDTKGRVIFAMKAWRALSPEAARLMVLLQAERARAINLERRQFTGIHFFAGKQFCYQLGLRSARRYTEVRDSVFAWLLEIQRRLDRYEWVSQPYRRFTNAYFYDFTLRIRPGGRADVNGSNSRRAEHSGAAPKDARYTKAWLRDLHNFAALMAYRADGDEVFGGLLPPPV